MKLAHPWPPRQEARSLLALCNTLLAFRIRHVIFLSAMLIALCTLTAFSDTAFAQQDGHFTTGFTRHTRATRDNGPTISNVSVGFDSRFRDGNWIPIRVTLDNSGSDFQGTVAINVPDNTLNGPNTPSIYQLPISLPSGAHKQVTFYAPFTLNGQGSVQTLTVNLLNSSGQVVTTQYPNLRTLNSTDIFVGVLSDQGNNFAPLGNASPAGSSSSVIVQPLDATTLPDNSVVLRNFDVIVVDNFTTASLSQAQLNALQNWVDQGGSLIVAGGPEWERTLKPLPASLVPVTPTTTGNIPAGTPLIPVGAPTSNGSASGSGNGHSSTTASVPISVASMASGTTLLTSGTTPLMVQASYGQGTVVYLAFDPSLDPINNWSGASTLWKGLLFRTVHAQLLVSASQNGSVSVPTGPVVPNKTANLDFNILLQSLLPNTIPAIWFILVLLLAYILILGPVRMLLVRFLKKRDWSWRITLITIVVFSLLSYGLAVQQQGTSIVSDSVSIVQMSGTNTSTTATSAHITTFQGVFVPNQGDYQLHIPQGSLVQPVNSINGPNQSASMTTVVPSAQANDVTLHGVDIWTLRSIVSERDQTLNGGISSHLSLTDGGLQGTVTNTLPYNLSEVYILIGGQYVSVGSLASGQTAQVLLSSLGSYDPTSSPTIADQLAQANGLSNYGSYYGQQLQNDTQRHIAVLSALSGSGAGGTYCINGTCYTQSYTAYRPAPLGSTGGSFVVMSGGGPVMSYHERDPLTIPGAAATLIGWADPGSARVQSDITGNVTINGKAAQGRQEVLIQSPLHVAFSGSLTLDTPLLRGQLVDMQGLSLPFLVNNVYTMNAGRATFEYVAPTQTQFHGSSMTISESSTLPQMVGPAPNTGSGTQTDANSLTVQVYNWQSQHWESFSFNQFKLSIENAQPYISPNGRILIQLSNTDSTKSILFNQPLLSIQGSV